MHFVDLDVTRSFWELELLLRAIQKLPTTEPIRIKLPGIRYQGFLKDSAVFGILATAFAHNPTEVLVDSDNWTDAALSAIENTPSGILALHRAIRFFNRKSESIDEIKAYRLETIGNDHDGILEEEAHRGRSYTLVSIDPLYPLPKILKGETSRETIKPIIKSAVENSFGLSTANNLSIDSTKSDALVQCIYEIFKNTEEHATGTASEGLIPGVRYAQIRKHIANSVDLHIPRAQGFDELTEYLKRLAGATMPRTSTLLEVSFGDCGFGILEHFASIRTSFLSTMEADKGRLQLLREIIATKLSTHDHASSGSGFEDAFYSAQSLNAFVSLRVDKFWLYRSPYDTGSPTSLKETALSERGLARVRGTHLSLLVPWTHEAPVR